MSFNDLSKVHNDWHAVLRSEFEADYFKTLIDTIKKDQTGGATIYPPDDQIFRAFHHHGPQGIRVVILGQDPYHGEGQAMGLSFSVPEGIKIPPSLRNIYKEISDDIGANPPKSGDLSQWSRQGVFLLNSALTVKAGQAGSHSKIGWHKFTDTIIAHLNASNAGLVFLLWGAHAISKSNLIDREKHLILESVHPSPLSAYRGFFGCKHFSKANAWLNAQGHKSIDW